MYGVIRCSVSVISRERMSGVSFAVGSTCSWSARFRDTRTLGGGLQTSLAYRYVDVRAACLLACALGTLHVPRAARFGHAPRRRADAPIGASSESEDALGDG